ARVVARERGDVVARDLPLAVEDEGRLVVLRQLELLRVLLSHARDALRPVLARPVRPERPRLPRLREVEQRLAVVGDDVRGDRRARGRQTHRALLEEVALEEDGLGLLLLLVGGLLPLALALLALVLPALVVLVLAALLRLLVLLGLVLLGLLGLHALAAH